MANMGPQGILKHIDDPSVTVIAAASAAGVTWVSDSTGSATDFVKAVAAGKGLHYYGVMSGADNELLEFCSNNLIFAAQEGHCAVEILVQFSSASVPAFTFGFNDTVEDGNLPIDISGTTLAATASTFCGFVYDGTDATNKDLYCVWVDDDSLAQSDATGKVGGQTIRMNGIHPTASKWLYLKVELQDRGSGNGARATFLAVDHLGRSAEKVFDTTVDRDCPLCYHFAIETRADTAMYIYLKGCNWEQTIPNM
jgi:hypothetical protein